MPLVMDETRIRFSAKLTPTDAIGVYPAAPVVRVRDVLIWTSGAADVSPEESRAHPPIAFAIWPGTEAGPVQLGRGLRIDRLSDDDAELVMNACTPRGHYFAPHRQFGQVCSFVRDIDVEERDTQRFRWDPDGVISDALMLSRWIRDNSQSTAFAARIADFANGEQTVVYTLTAEGKTGYRLRRDRDWLDENEGRELRESLRAFWSIGDARLPPRVQRAIFRTEYASWLKWGDLALSTLVGGLEALLKTKRGNATHQFKTRVPALAAELGFEGITADYCERMYDARSEWVHGAHVQLFAAGLEHQQADEQGTQEGPSDNEQRDALADIARLQDVLRRAVRRCIEDAELRATFVDDDLIGARWPL